MTGADRQGGYIATYRGGRFWPMDPRADEIHVVDIARALAMTCRYRGHCRFYYSVAEHSVLISRAVPEADALAGLLHDAPEAYLGDMASPIKRYMPDYRAIEDRLAVVVAERFGLTTIEPPSVKSADARIIADEAPRLFLDTSPFVDLPQALGVEIAGLPPEAAFDAWLERYTELTGDRSFSVGQRERLPNRRLQGTHRLELAGTTIFLGIGLDLAGKPREVFLTGGKDGSEIQLLVQHLAIILSIALQRGASPQDLLKTVARSAELDPKWPALLVPAVLDKLIAEMPA